MITDPTWIFFVVLGIILFAPMLLERLRIPSVVGMIAAGVAIGPHAAGILQYDNSFRLFGNVGLYYIMFLASLEMNLQEVNKIRWRALLFGLMTFAVPMSLGFAANSLLGYSVAAALLMAAMYASHTLITYPLVQRYGLSRSTAVNLSVGSTIVADTLTLIVLAVVTSSLLQGEEGGWGIALLLVKVIAASALLIYGLPYVCRWFLRRFSDVVVQYIGVLCMLFFGAGLMKAIGMEGLLGAFIVGIALNRDIPPSSPLMTHIEFVGNAIFIPYFLIGVGMIVNIGAFFSSLDAIYLAAVMIGVSCLSKWLASWLTQKMMGMSHVERRLMFGLTNARAAATLAIVLVGYNIVDEESGIHLLGDEVVNAAMALILASCLISSVATERAAHRMVLDGNFRHNKRHEDGRILVALSHPDMVENLMTTALMLRTPHSSAQLSALHVVMEDNADLRERGREILNHASRVASSASVSLATQCRWSVNLVTGISHCAREMEVTDVLIGLHHRRNAADAVLGKFTYDLMAELPQQVIICHPTVPLNTIRHLHIIAPRKAEYDPGFERWMERVALLASQIRCPMTVYSGRETMTKMDETWQKRGFGLETEFTEYYDWHDFSGIAARMRGDHLAVFVNAHHGLPSHHHYMEHLPEQIDLHFGQLSFIFIMPPVSGAVRAKTAAAARSGGIVQS